MSPLKPVPRPVRSWADELVKQGIISLDQLQEARDAARSSSLRIEDVLLREGHAEEEQIMRAKAQFSGLEYVDLQEIEISQDVIDRVPESFARENFVLAIAAEGSDWVKVAISNPDNFQVIENLEFQLSPCRVKLALATQESIQQAVNRYYGGKGDMATVFGEMTKTEIDFTEAAQGVGGDEIVDENSAPIVKLVHMMISEAVKRRASDIHVEPFEDRVRIRFRIDGVLIEKDSVPRRLLSAVLSRIKILAKIDIAERRRPQDGRIKVTVGTKELDLRVSVLPTNHGQSVVMRLLDKDNIKVGLRQIGFSEEDFNVFNQIIRRPNGIILVTGPTGSGKTTTLYAALNELNKPDRKIITAEDPVEYYLPGINQVEVRHNIGLDFARIIRSMLRQAPNVILVGEIRDRETAEMAIQASLTGHLVFSTLHTNDAPSSITRMIDIGVPPYLVASSVVAIMAQRLVRKVCEECKQPYRPSDPVLQQAGIPIKVAEKANFMKGKGCAHCSKKGYRGRIAIFELMPVNSKVRELAFKGAASQDIRKLAVSQGMKTLYKDGIIKAIKGITTLDEVFRVASKK